MRRRTFIAALGSAAAWPVVGRAEPKRPTIGYLGGGRSIEVPWPAAFGRC